MKTASRARRGDDAHLHNAAATLQAILNAEYPEHSWIVEVRTGEHGDAGDQVEPASTPRTVPDHEST